MGAPPRLRRKYEVPRKAWEKERLEKERELVDTYGIRRKRELRHMESVLRNLKRGARGLIGKPNAAEEQALVEKAKKLGLVSEYATLDSILSLTIESVLERRLQTQLLKRGMANSPEQARQFIVHGHVRVAGQKITSPAYLVKRGEDGQIAFAEKSSLARLRPAKPSKVETKVETGKARAAEVKEPTPKDVPSKN